jgi:hypothetical protein
MEEVKYPVIRGTYQHYKGGIYEVLMMATHTETAEPMVVYKSTLFGSNYCRPLSYWNKEADNGKERFVLIKTR